MISRDAAERIMELDLAHGGVITPAMIVAEAAPDDSPLHGYFTWDDSVAGALHRENEARRLIRSVRVEHHSHGEKTYRVQYVRSPFAEPHTQGYTAIRVLKTDAARCVEVLNAELDRLERSLARVRAIAAELEQTEMVDKWLSEIADWQNKLALVS